MRLWSIHPKYLDSMGLVALWREGLLAQKVLLGETKGYKAHPQLIRFRNTDEPVLAIGCYLHAVFIEAEQRSFSFDATKIVSTDVFPSMPVQRGQMDYEWEHLLNKLKNRAPSLYEINKTRVKPLAHPLFKITPGGIAQWEVLQAKHRINS